MALLNRGHSRFARTLVRTAGVVQALALAVLLFAGGVSAQKRAASFDEVKAAFVYQFANFITWPEDAFPDAGTPVTIGIVDNETVADVLRESVRGKTAAGREIIVREVTTPAQAVECQIVYLDKSDQRRVDEYLAVLVGKPILTVSDDDDFTEKGGVIRVFEQQNKPKIEINVDEAERSGLTISSKLLSLAIIVHDNRT